MTFDSSTANFILALILAIMSFLWPRLTCSDRVLIEILLRRVLFPWNPLYRNVWAVYLDAWLYRRSQASMASYPETTQFYALWNTGAYTRLRESPAWMLYSSINSSHPSLIADLEWLHLPLMPDLMLILERDRQRLEDADRADNYLPGARSQNLPQPNDSPV